jgi:hypothetical protein
MFVRCEQVREMVQKNRRQIQSQPIVKFLETLDGDFKHIRDISPWHGERVQAKLAIAKLVPNRVQSGAPGLDEGLSRPRNPLIADVPHRFEYAPFWTPQEFVTCPDLATRVSRLRSDWKWSLATSSVPRVTT